MSDPDPFRPPTADEVAERHGRLRGLLAERGATGLVIGRRDDFAWATYGGDGKLQETSEHTVGLLVVTPERVELVAYEMDADRLLQEQCPDQGVEAVALRWTDGDLAEHVVHRAGPGPVLADVALAGTEPVALGPLQVPLTPLEQARVRWVGARVDRIVADVAEELRPGRTEREVAGELARRCLADGLQADELMVGFDDRVERYRHPVATGARLERYALLHPTVSRWGLHGIVTRSVHLGAPPAELRRRFDACATVEAASIAASRPGTRFREIHEERVARFAALGFPGEEQHHFQGGRTGYQLYDPAHVTAPEDAVVDGSLLDWFVSIRGAKTEETVLVTGGEPTVPTLAGAWPTVRVGTDDTARPMADLLVR